MKTPCRCGTEVQCALHNPPFNYARNGSHNHCWKQGSPACGIPLKKHKQCCLCDKPFPKNKKTAILAVSLFQRETSLFRCTTKCQTCALIL